MFAILVGQYTAPWSYAAVKFVTPCLLDQGVVYYPTIFKDHIISKFLTGKYSVACILSSGTVIKLHAANFIVITLHLQEQEVVYHPTISR